jgi:uncharacterized protein YxeA
MEQETPIRCPLNGRKVINMKRLLIVLVAVLMMFGFSAAAYAEHGEKAATGGQSTVVPEKKMESKEKAVGFSGTVTAVDKTTKTIVVKGKEGEKTFDVSKATKAEILPGEVVAVKYAEEGGKMVASSVTMVAPELSNNAKQGVSKELGIKHERM